MLRAMTTAVLLLLGACVEEDADVVRVLVPEDVDLHWDASFNGEDDGIAAVVPVDVMVYVDETGEPLEAVQLQLTTEDPLALAASVDDVLLVEADDCFDCELTWDTWRDRYVELPVGIYDAADEGITLETDPDGIARAYIIVDAFPLSADGVEPIEVRVGMGTAEDAFLLTPR